MAKHHSYPITYFVELCHPFTPALVHNGMTPFRLYFLFQQSAFFLKVQLAVAGIQITG
jgi:hypothetical protein